MNDSVRTAEIQAHFERFTRSVETLSKEAGRAVGEVRLVAVSKNFPIEDVASARGLGQRVFGENRVQELLTKVLEAEALGLDVVWHMIGHLQTNKVRQVVGQVALIHSVDRRRLLNAVEKEANKK
ncbi:MAG: YggS family pyridoxal phosphate-dependent enzyme, partial [Clostridiaceae bacterium]|nr:YggS family pyridoxal phosphate-dependent enzyme [Clostridiaceae bacterium]